MIKNNKVINKVLLQKVLLLCSLVSFSSSASIYMIQQKKAQTTDHMPKQDIFLICLVALLIVFSFMEVYSDYEKTGMFLKSVAHKYLKQELKNNPDLKPFEKVLNNSQAMQNISALIFNNLRPSERKIVAKTLVNMHNILRNHKKYYSADTNFLKTSKAIINDARDQIVPIIQGHASVHPEFIRDIYSAMARADMIYIMKNHQIQQNTK